MGTGRCPQLGHRGCLNEPTSAEADPAANPGPGAAPESLVDPGGEESPRHQRRLLSLQVESEPQRRHVVDAWGDQLTQKTKVRWGGPGVPGHQGSS